MSIVQAHMVMKISVKVRFLVLIVVALIQHQALTVLLTSVGMRVLQSNVQLQSVGTSLPLLRHTLQHQLFDIALLQEIWHPTDDSFQIRNYVEPIMKLHQGKECGGVVILRITRLNRFI